jgi:hypothetical protein
MTCMLVQHTTVAIPSVAAKRDLDMAVHQVSLFWLKGWTKSWPHIEDEGSQIPKQKMRDRSRDEEASDVIIDEYVLEAVLFHISRP